MKSFLVLFLLPLVALAGAPNDGPPEEPPQEPPSWERVLKMNQDVDVENTNVNTNIVKTEVGAQAEADADANAIVGDTTAIAKGGEGGQGGQGGQGGAGGASTVGDTTATVGNVTGGSVSVVNEGNKVDYPRQAPPAYAPSVFPSSDKCDSGGFSIALSSPVGGVSAGKGKGKPSKTPSDDCLFSLSQQFAAGGRYDLWCRTLMASNSATYVFREDEVKPICDNVQGPAPLVQTPAQNQPTIVVLPVGAPGTDFDEKLKRAFEAAMANPK
ncbi:MAG: hypothetical protein WBL19_01590 [Minisyncoccia bacterium]